MEWGQEEGMVQGQRKRRQRGSGRGETDKGRERRKCWGDEGQEAVTAEGGEGGGEWGVRQVEQALIATTTTLLRTTRLRT